MAKNFTTVEGTAPDGSEVKHDLSTKDVDEYELLFEIKPSVGLIYKKQRHVVQVQCPRGIVPSDSTYMPSISYGSRPSPSIVYIDLKTKKMLQATPAEFAEWLGKEWQAEEAPESAETKKEKAALDTLGKTALLELDEAEKIPEDKKGKANWKPMTTKKAKQRSKKSSTKKDSTKQ